MLNLKIDLNKIDSKKVNSNFQNALMKAMLKMEELAVDKAPVDTGFLKQRITLFPQILSNNYTLTSKAPYSEDIEFGNNPRNVKWDDIEQWIKRKGIRTNPNTISAFTKYVVNKIKTKGVNAQPFMRPAYYEVKRFWLKKYLNDGFK